VDGSDLQAKKLGAMLPVSVEQMLDAGMPVPPGLADGLLPARKPLSRRIRWRMARAEFIETLRRRVGFWIAGYEPDDDWDW
jgi:hypothetical protein